MRSRNFLFVAAISALAAAPAFAQQKTQQPASKVVSSASRDSTKTSARKHRPSTSAQSKSAATASPSKASAKSGPATTVQHKPAKHRTARKPKNATTDTSK